MTGGVSISIDRARAHLAEMRVHARMAEARLQFAMQLEKLAPGALDLLQDVTALDAQLARLLAGVECLAKGEPVPKE